MCAQISNEKLMLGACPECDADVPILMASKRGSRVQCPDCRASLIVIGLTPIELDWAFEEPLIDSAWPTDHSGYVSRRS